MYGWLCKLGLNRALAVLVVGVCWLIASPSRSGRL
jgi:hypothetical protein